MRNNLKILSDGTVCQEVTDPQGVCLGFKKRDGTRIYLADAAAGRSAPLPFIPPPRRGAKPRGEKWARKFDECVVCESTEHLHRGHGMCMRCYPKYHDKADAIAALTREDERACQTK